MTAVIIISSSRRFFESLAVIIPLMAILLTSVANGANYCDELLCLDVGLPHAACNHTGKPADICQKFKMISMTNERKTLLLDVHNRLRNKIAAGEEKLSKDGPLPSATSMNMLIWDDELAYLAQLNVMSCVMRHDCSRTETFPHAGQNLGSAWSTSVDYFQASDPLLADIIRRWYDEVADCDLSLLQSYENIEDGIQRGHFTQLVRDEATHMGCAASFFRQPHPDFGFVHVLLMACNYSEGNLLEAPTYEIGPSCSKCKKCNIKYTSLCEPA